MLHTIFFSYQKLFTLLPMKISYSLDFVINFGPHICWSYFHYHRYVLKNLPAHIYNSSIRKHGRPRTFFHNIIHKCRASCNYLRHIQVFLGRSPEKDSTQTRRKVSSNEVYIFALSFYRSQNVLCRSKFFEHLTAFSASSKPFVPAKKPILPNTNHLFVWLKMCVTATICE